MKPAIVVVAFNRPRSLERLLRSLNDAVYQDQNITLIISIDKCDTNQDVLEIAKAFQWEYGTKEVVYQSENLKLRKHIIKCAGYSSNYGSVIILEDDLYVSPYFYEYAVAALEFSETDNRVAGVSLYNHCVNVNNSEPFEKIDDGYDNWYLQLASSWGEAWTKKQWEDFYQWYTQHQDMELAGNDIPAFVSGWPASSWLKYFIKYLVGSNKYFFYPRISLTTNFGDAGTNAFTDSTDFQVALQCAPKEFCFSKLDNSRSVYDSFFENTLVATSIGFEGVDIDLYGTKPIGRSQYLLSRNIYDCKIIKSYACSMRPHEANIMQQILGKDFFLYDTSNKEKNSHVYDDVRKMRYCVRYIRKENYKTLLKMIFSSAMRGLKRRFK